MTVLALVPARAGSRRIPNKNLRDFCGRPLIEWTLESALNCNLIDSVVVSTDSSAIASLSVARGAEVPFLRPHDLASDSAATIDVVMHAIKKLPKFDHLLLLQPTSPLRTTDDLTEAITLASVNDFFSVISVSRTHPPLEWALEIAADGSMSRAISDKGYVGASRLTYTPNGAVYLAERDWLQREVTLLGQGTRPYIMPPERSVDIDTEFDWQVAEMVMERRQSGKNFGDWR